MEIFVISFLVDVFLIKFCTKALPFWLKNMKSASAQSLLFVWIEIVVEADYFLLSGVESFFLARNYEFRL